MRNKKTLLLSALLAVCGLSNAQDNPRMTSMDLTAKEMAHYMAPGWNLGNTMEACSMNNVDTNKGGLASETSWQGTKTTQEIINFVKEQGYSSVRIPCGWVAGHITDATSTTIDATWMARVKEIVDYCLNANLNVVLNDHWDGGWLEHDGFTSTTDVDAKKTKLKQLWTQIANEFKNYDERLLFAGLNEPGVGGGNGTVMSDKKALTERLIEYEQTFIDAVRATGGNNANRILIVQGPDTNISETDTYFDITKLTDTAQNRLMVEVHFYEPYQFCQMTEDASWGNMQYYWNNSSCNYTSSTHKGTYADNTVTDQLKKMKTKFVDKGYPVIIGEYGTMWRDLSGKSGESQSKHNASVEYWMKLVTQNSMTNGLIPFQWDTNYTGNNSMSTIKRSNCSVANTYLMDGVTDGMKSGRTAFNMIYPTPSSESAGISTMSNDQGHSSAIYSVTGQKVSNGEKDGLTKGVYVSDGKAFMVK